jgi:Domain of unknown function (DUF427)
MTAWPGETCLEEAVYWRGAGREGPGLAWSHPEPFPEVARLAGYVAFDQDEVRVTIGKGTFTGGAAMIESSAVRCSPRKGASLRRSLRKP